MSTPRPVIDHAYRGGHEGLAGWWIGLAYSPQNVERIKSLIPWRDRSWSEDKKEWWIAIEYQDVFAAAFPAFEAYLTQGALPGF